jgi:glycosyltransferase involved in cell wall biosynthesis
VSQFSRHELHEHFRIPLEKMIVVPPGCDHLLTVKPEQGILERNSLESGKYVLGVGSRSPIKNFEGLARAWNLLARSDMKLAVAGGTNSRIFGDHSAREQRNIHWLGYVSDGALRTLYENAAVFVYPSFYEGFGLPPIEAMGCGCPVVVSNSSALPESCGAAALYCNPSAAHDIAAKISDILDNSSLAEEMRRKGRERASQFTVRRAAESLWSELSKNV